LGASADTILRFRLISLRIADLRCSRHPAAQTKGKPSVSNLDSPSGPAGPAEHHALLGGLRGIERETLRVDDHGHLASTPHPLALGSALTHPQITTDYAETCWNSSRRPKPTSRHHRQARWHPPLRLQQAGRRTAVEPVHAGQLPAEEDIAIAWYGSSNMGMLKHVYRRGLALRYGKAMQCIAGIHYNYSLDEGLWRCWLPANRQPSADRQGFQSDAYLATIRNFRRYSWLLMYLFGASPVLQRLPARPPHKLDTLSDDTLYLPYATSLRMSDLGYQNDAQSGLSPHENCLDSYVAALTKAVNQPYAPYAALGTKRDGEWIQLSTNVLQIENEYYSTIRPKRVIQTGERPIQALCARGVQYIEVRCMDVDPFEPVGISLTTGRFLDAFLLFCALEKARHHAGRRLAPHRELCPHRQGRPPSGPDAEPRRGRSPLPAWGRTCWRASARGGPARRPPRRQRARRQRWPRRRPSWPIRLTPSAKVLAALRANGNSFAAFGLAQSERMRPTSAAIAPSADEARLLRPPGRGLAGRAGRHGSGAAHQLRRLRGRLPRQQSLPLSGECD
jgi:glutamate--cysteine ligase